jgi:uncharacterized membrane protein YccC
LVNTVLIKHKGLRRALGAVLVVVGGVLMWLAPEVWPGVVLLGAGIALEIAGIALEHRNGRSRDDSHAVER